MTFRDHLVKRPDGTYDLGEAEAARARELATDNRSVEALAARAASAERAAFERSEGDRRRKQLQDGQMALSAELDLDVLVPLGNGIFVELGDMNADRIHTRMDLEADSFAKHAASFSAARAFWTQALDIVGAGTIAEPSTP